MGGRDGQTDGCRQAGISITARTITYSVFPFHHLLQLQTARGAGEEEEGMGRWTEWMEKEMGREQTDRHTERQTDTQTDRKNTTATNILWLLYFF